MVVNRRSLTKRDFDAAVKRLGIADRGVDMARRVLVAGEAAKAVATDMNVTISAVSHQVTRVWQAHVDSIDIPAGHERVEAVLPADKAEIVRSWARDTRRPR